MLEIHSHNHMATTQLLEIHDKLAKEVVTPVAEATVLFNRLDEIGHLMSFEDQKEMVLSQAAKTELVLACTSTLALSLMTLTLTLTPRTHSL